jgi:trehalose-6-phosphatase
MCPWQERLLNDLVKSRHELVIIASGRGVGKSIVREQYMEWKKLFGNNGVARLQGPLMVNGKPWYVVNCGQSAAQWLRQQDKNQWCEHEGTLHVFDVSEELYIMLGLKWQS